MRSIPSRRQATLALRIAGGLGPFAAARAAGIDESDVRDLLHVASFQEMVGSWTQILAMDPAARRQRLELLARLRQKFAALPPSSLALMLERAPPDLAPYFTVLAREARQGKLWPKGP